MQVKILEILKLINSFLRIFLYFKIRSAWKKYAKIQKQLYELYKKLDPNAEKIYGCDANSKAIELFIEENEDAGNNVGKSNNPDEKILDADHAFNDLTISDDDGSLHMPLDVVKRLLGAVSLGYGIFQIMLR